MKSLTFFAAASTYPRHKDGTLAFGLSPTLVAAELHRFADAITQDSLLLQDITHLESSSIEDFHLNTLTIRYAPQS